MAPTGSEKFWLYCTGVPAAVLAASVGAFGSGLHAAINPTAPASNAVKRFMHSSNVDESHGCISRRLATTVAERPQRTCH
jgi:hypothetical protein